MARAKADATGMKFERPAAVAAFAVESAPGFGGLLWKRLQKREEPDAVQVRVLRGDGAGNIDAAWSDCRLRFRSS